VLTVEADPPTFQSPDGSDAALQEAVDQVKVLRMPTMAGLRRVLQEVAGDIEPMERSPRLHSLVVQREQGVEQLSALTEAP